MINIRPLKKEDNRKNFSCGKIELDYYFQKFAGQNQFKHFVGTTYISTDDKTIFGFITVSAGSLMCDELPQTVRKKFPLYPLPVLHITRMGVDVNYQNRGVGRELIATAFRLAVEQKKMKMVGCIGVLVDAKVEAIPFYERLGFVKLEAKRGIPKKDPKPIPMFMVIQTIEKAL
ncbi:GNAT family N-acetyltransferase [bacterium]|nr:GNAT family N-acetyltransferase [bacterium]MBU1957054.1 GNAT family N-acetyltransferase [bacterium]